MSFRLWNRSRRHISCILISYPCELHIFVSLFIYLFRVPCGVLCDDNFKLCIYLFIYLWIYVIGLSIVLCVFAATFCRWIKRFYDCLDERGCIYLLNISAFGFRAAPNCSVSCQFAAILCTTNHNSGDTRCHTHPIYTPEILLRPTIIRNTHKNTNMCHQNSCAKSTPPIGGGRHEHPAFLSQDACTTKTTPAGCRSSSADPVCQCLHNSGCPNCVGRPSNCDSNSFWCGGHDDDSNSAASINCCCDRSPIVRRNRGDDSSSRRRPVKSGRRSWPSEYLCVREIAW